MMFIRTLQQRFEKGLAVGFYGPKEQKKELDKRPDFVILGGRGYHSSYGGVENAIRNITDEMLEAHQLEILVYGTDSSEVAESSLHNPKLQYYYAPNFIYRSLGQHGATFACVLHALLVARPRAVIIFASGPSIFVPLFRLFGKPVITSLRAIDSARDKWGRVSRRILQVGEYFAWRYASAFTANSMEMIDAFKAMRGDVVFVPNGGLAAVDGESRIRQKYNLRDRGYFLFAARLDPAKRLHHLLEAHANLDPRDRLPLVIAGGHSKSEEYQQTLMRYAGPRVIFLGHISAEDLDPLMLHCRAFLLPSALEGMSNSLLTAMSSGCAVLASDIPPNADVLQDADATFPTDDVACLQAGLRRLAREPDFAKRLGRRLQRHARANYTWRRTSELFYTQLKLHTNEVYFDD